ncbi:MAG: hypothetical protein FWG35_07885, partial [Spirochaetaceae bacterium]|nr:hypothetical protein [Spirochaetaceae bacterium]
MNNTVRKMFFVLLVVYALAFLAFLCWSYFTVPSIRMDGPRRAWVLGNTLVLFARNIIPLHLAAVLFVVSLYFSPDRARNDKRGIFKRFKFLIILFLVLIFGCTVLMEAGLPLGLRLREDATGKIEQADELRLKARDATSRGQLREARRYLQYALVIFPEDEDLRRELDVADRAVRFAGEAAQKRTAAPQQSPLLLNMTFDDFLARAQNAFDREDYISAEYYANFALRMNFDHPIPRRIIARARDKLTESIPGRAVQADMDFFRRKQDVADILAKGGAADIIEAYRAFQSLAEERPDDPDVRYYLRLANAELRKAAFLLSEIPLTAFGSPQGGVVFINRADVGDREFLYIGQMVKTPTAYYALDIEGLGLGPDGAALYRFGAPYGKFAGNALLMHCVDDEGAGEYEASYYTGRPSEENKNLLPCEADPEELFRVCAGDSAYRSFALWSLLETARAAPSLGISPAPLFQAFFLRLSQPFAFFVLTVFAAAWGMRLHSRYAAAPPIAYFLFLPLLLLVA